MRYSLLMLTLFPLFGCNNCDLEQHNQFYNITKSDLAHLDSINVIMFRNANKIDYEDGKSFEEQLEGEDLINFKRHINAFENDPEDSSKIRFTSFMNFMPSDSTVHYEIKSEICDNARRQTDIFHHLLFSPTQKDNSKLIDAEVVKKRKLNDHWTYYIINEEYAGR